MISKTTAMLCVMAGLVLVFSLPYADAACAEMSGYVALENSDRDGSDIGQAATALDAMAKCNADINCKGFNTQGYYKKEVTPMTTLQGVCLYVKATNCPIVDGYFAWPNTDHFGANGDDIGKADSFAAAVTRCNADSACKGFNSAGYHKKVVAPVHTTAWSCLYTKECPTISNFIAFAHTDHWYDDIGRAFSPTDAMYKCAYDSNCKGFNSLGWYKSTTSPAAKLTGICLYTKSSACPQVPGYTVAALSDHWGDDIGRAASFQDAIDKCNANAACKGFNNLGWYKRAVTPTQANGATCLYTKGAQPTPSPNPNPGPSPKPGPTCKLLWADEFNGAGLDTSIWNSWVGTAYNNELQYYTGRQQNVRVEGGNLVLEARAESYGGRSYTSGRIDTANHKYFVPGMADGGVTYPTIKVEARIKLPKGQGYWPAFWMMPNESPYGGWPYSGEIDIMEGINQMDTAYFTIHYTQNNQHASKGGNYATSDMALVWHTYAVEWTATRMIWYMDGVPRFTAYSSSVDANGWRTTSQTSKPTGPNSPFDTSFYVILNFAVGGDWPGSPNSGTVFPAQMLVDYVRVLGC